MALIEHLPIWLIGLVMLVALIILHELGFQTGRRIEKDRESGDGKGHLVGAALALLGLMMAFTFSAAQDRFNMRQRMVVDEANALGTTYLRIQTLDLPARDILSRQMLRYAQLRQDFFIASASPESLEKNTRLTSDMQDEIWPVLTSAVRTNPDPDAECVAVADHQRHVRPRRIAPRRDRCPGPCQYPPHADDLRVGGPQRSWASQGQRSGATRQSRRRCCCC